jgi:hypothetical protein
VLLAHEPKGTPFPDGQSMIWSMRKPSGVPQLESPTRHSTPICWLETLETKDETVGSVVLPPLFAEVAL